jgi:hypothetical protein
LLFPSVNQILTHTVFCPLSTEHLLKPKSDMPFASPNVCKSVPLPPSPWLCQDEPKHSSGLILALAFDLAILLLMSLLHVCKASFTPVDSLVLWGHSSLLKVCISYWTISHKELSEYTKHIGLKQDTSYIEMQL